jgi:4-diphosphocytidyl-2-C-methyl-D-erythritol kinase
VGVLTGKLSLRAFAKVNYALEVRGLRDDGYHEISSVLQSVSLADEVEIERAEEGFELCLEPEETEVGPLEQNTVRKAWGVLCGLAGAELPVRVRLHKKIPTGAGLGGGSADAAATLVGLNELFGLGLSAEELRGVGTKIGADVPFALAGGTVLAEGVGEILNPLPAPPAHRFLIAKPERGADTGGIYRAYDERPVRGTPSADPVVAALRSGSLGELAHAIGNDLEPVTSELVPEVGAYKREMLQAGALGAAMTGTGTAVYGLFEADDDGTGATEASLRAPFVGACEPVGAGVVML